jgi:hypothetical protein
MMATPHMMAGAAIGKTLRRPWLALPAAFLSHFLLDAVPHLDSHYLFGVEQGGPTVPEAAVAVADFVFGCWFVAWLVRGRRDRKLLLAAALCAIVIDLVDNVPPWGVWFSAWPVTAGLSEFHHALQVNVAWGGYPLGIATQVVTMGIALWALWPRARWQPARTSG